MTSPGTYYNPPIQYTDATEHLRGKPLLSAPIEFAIVDEHDGSRRERTAVVRFLAPVVKTRGKMKGTESVRVWINGATFSLAMITPKGSKESFVNAMFEDADSSTFNIEFGSDVAYQFLYIDMAARCGDEQALSAVAAAECGIFLRRLRPTLEGAS